MTVGCTIPTTTGHQMFMRPEVWSPFVMQNRHSNWKGATQHTTQLTHKLEKDIQERARIEIEGHFYIYNQIASLHIGQTYSITVI